jgi:hypothetical protein
LKIEARRAVPSAASGAGERRQRERERERERESGVGCNRGVFIVISHEFEARAGILGRELTLFASEPKLKNPRG